MKSVGRVARAVALCTMLASALPGMAQGYYATQLTSESIQRMPEGGLDAVGGIGDWFFTDGMLCAVISDSKHPTYLSLQGGSLVDLWHCELANDQWSVSHTQLNLQKDQIPPTDHIRSGFDADESWIETRGTKDGLETVIRYQFIADAPGQLQLVTSIKRRGDGKRLGMVGILTLHPRASLIPFAIDSDNPQDSPGFSIPDTDTTSLTSILSSVTKTDLQVLLGSRHITPTISYGLNTPKAEHIDDEGSARPLGSFMMNGREFTMFGLFSRPFPDFWPERPGMVSFGVGQLFDLRNGEELQIRQTIEVSRRADAAFFTDKRFTGEFVTGKVDSGEAGINVTTTDGNPLTFARADTSGNFSFRLPANVVEYELHIETPWGKSSHRKTTIDGAQLGTLPTGTPGRLILPQGSPMSLMFTSENPPTIFHSELAPLHIGDERQLLGPENYRLSLSGTAADPAEVQLPPGEYRIAATRGPEYSVSETVVQLHAGREATLDIPAPRRVVATPGMIGVDFHVHSGASFDSSLSPVQRVIDFVAQGGEVLVPTEHNISYDIRPTIASLGLSDMIFSFPGVEITGMARSDDAPSTIGHSNVFPIAVDPHAFMGGTLRFEGKRLGQVIAAYKARFPDSIFQLNHPRTEAYDDDITFFNHLSQGVAFDPAKPLQHGDNALLLEELPETAFRDIDFDAVELLNGESMDIYELVRRDWFALLKQNVYKVATANSDSHVSSQVVAYPRSYVEVENDDPATITAAEIIKAVKEGRLYGSTGPIISVRLGEAAPGGTFVGAKGKLTISLDQAPWVTAGEARIWLNDTLWKTQPISPGRDLHIDIDVGRDSFIFVEVAGESSAMYSTILPGFRPFAFANPVFIDVAGDGWFIEENLE